MGQTHAEVNRLRDTASTSGQQPINAERGTGISRSPSKQSLLPTKRQLIWSKVEALSWIGAAWFVIWYGDGEKGFWSVARFDERVKKPWLCAGLGFLGVDFVTFLYLSIWVKRLKHRSKDAAKAAPSVVTTETLSTTAAGILFTVAFWPVWRYVTPVVLVVLFMAFTMHPQLRPSSWSYQKKRRKD